MQSTDLSRALQDLNGVQLNGFRNILKACKAYNVESIEIAGVKVQFRAQVLAKTTDAGDVTGTNAIEPPKPLLTPFDEQAMRNAERAQLLIDDPSAHEREVIDDFLREADHAGTSDSRPQ